MQDNVRAQRENETSKQREQRLRKMQHNARERRECETLDQWEEITGSVCEQARMRRKGTRVESLEDGADPRQKASKTGNTNGCEAVSHTSSTTETLTVTEVAPSQFPPLLPPVSKPR